ncbi:hypothetical protein BS47DRAFT_1395432 [Hydnum rufescens UP504]|uniref:MRH domain-containing protein n=1 Tax=Hydnum rufescens UP504 TaxID=1448309 RepID=A0A9P6AUD8_9AGAM|nr:hypothetical protein BS47DRAFT_1395432 [Hydnum rufescens UP504]
MFHSTAVFLTILAISSSIGALGADSHFAPCTGHDGKNFFDLNPLRSKYVGSLCLPRFCRLSILELTIVFMSWYHRTDYEVTTDIGDLNITLNVCGGVVSETWKLDEAEKAAGFYRGPHSDVSIGQINTTLRIAYGHPVLTLINGSPCGKATGSNGSGTKLSSVIQFTCDPNVFSRGNPHLLAQMPPGDQSPCAFFFEWRTHHAQPRCPGVMGALSSFLLSCEKASDIDSSIWLLNATPDTNRFFIAFFAYVVAATFYNRLVLGLRGWEQVPKFTCGGLCNVRPGRLFGSRPRDLSEPTWGSWRRDRSGYGRISAEEVEAMADGRFSLDEEDEGERDNQLLESGIPPSGGHDSVIRLS